MSKKRKKHTTRKLKNLDPKQLHGHLDEKFTPLAVAYRGQVAARYQSKTNGGAPRKQIPNCLLQAAIGDMLEIDQFLVSSRAEFFDWSSVGFVTLAVFRTRVALAGAQYQAHEYKTVSQRWQRASEHTQEHVDIPDWFGLLT